VVLTDFPQILLEPVDVGRGDSWICTDATSKNNSLMVENSIRVESHQLNHWSICTGKQKRRNIRMCLISLPILLLRLPKFITLKMCL